MKNHLSDHERNIRSNIRNAFFIASRQELDKEIEHRLSKGDNLSVKFLRELKSELDN